MTRMRRVRLICLSIAAMVVDFPVPVCPGKQHQTLTEASDLLAYAIAGETDLVNLGNVGGKHAQHD